MGGYFLSAQPATFKWNESHKNPKTGVFINYISEAKNQKNQGPCGAFAAVAAVEATSQIYFNKTSWMLDLSESWLYHQCDSACPGLGCAGIAPGGSLDFIKLNGVVNDSCFPYPEKPQGDDSLYCYLDCKNFCYNPEYRVFIPHYSKIQVGNYIELKKAIMDYGPIVLHGTDENFGCVLHPDYPDCHYSHAVLIIGWETDTQWRYKDSWPTKPGETPRHGIFYFYDTLNLFTDKRIFYRVYPVYNGNTIYCTGNHCTLFNSRHYEDKDKDGFYNWGFDTYPKPAAKNNQLSS